MYNRIVPNTKGFNTFIMKSLQLSDDVEIIIGKSSYVLSLEEAKNWFLRVCWMDAAFTQRVFDYLYNFRCLKYLVNEARFIPYEEI